jgi:hypothetical protein
MTGGEPVAVEGEEGCKVGVVEKAKSRGRHGKKMEEEGERRLAEITAEGEVSAEVYSRR